MSRSKLAAEVEAVIHAVVKNGEILPIEPIPPAWTEGQVLRVEAGVEALPVSDIDDWVRDMEAAAARIDPADHDDLIRSLREIDLQERADRATAFNH